MDLLQGFFYAFYLAGAVGFFFAALKLSTEQHADYMKKNNGMLPIGYISLWILGAVIWPIIMFALVIYNILSK